jgi:hypothetical protein
MLVRRDFPRDNRTVRRRPLDCRNRIWHGNDLNMATVPVIQVFMSMSLEVTHHEPLSVYQIPCPHLCFGGDPQGPRHAIESSDRPELVYQSISEVGWRLQGRFDFCYNCAAVYSQAKSVEEVQLGKLPNCLKRRARGGAAGGTMSSKRKAGETGASLQPRDAPINAD